MRIPCTLLRICMAASLACGVSLALAGDPQPVPARPDLKSALDAAWQRSPQARALEARRDEMQAGRDAAGAWIAGSPALGLSERSDRWTERRGARETEVSLSAPVWLPGQKSARLAQAQTGADELEAQIAAARLALAGELREGIWAVAAAAEALAEAQQHQQHLAEIAGDVRRRVQAGDLAHTDGLLAQQELLAAQAAVAAAEGGLHAARARFLALTGQDGIPEPQPEPIAAAAADPHPRLAAAQAQLRRTQAALQVVAATRSEPPTLGVSLQRERDETGARASRSVTLALDIPLGTRARNRVRESAARTDAASAAAEAASLQVKLATEAGIARRQLAAAQAALDSGAARVALAREHARLTGHAFRLGERSLADLLRSRTLLHEAEAAQRQQRVALGLAHARLNDALGVLP